MNKACASYSSEMHKPVLPVLPSGNTGKVNSKSWKIMMDAGRDPRECIFVSLELIVSWLLAVALYTLVGSQCL